MNIDHSDGSHGNTRHHGDDVIDRLEGWDDSWSESCSTCSCSSCSTCSLCDLCIFEDFDQLSCHGNTEEAPQPSIQSNLSCLDTSGRTNVCRKTNLQSEQTSTTSNGRLFANESGFTMYSSGSDKETLSCSSSTNSNLTRTVDTNTESSSEEHLSNCLEKEKIQQHARIKKVTFMDSSMSDDSERLSLENGRTAKEIQESDSAQPVTKKNMCSNRNIKRIGWNKNLHFEHKRLESVLNHIDPFKLHSILQHQVRTKNPQTILALGKIFPKRKFSGETVHCVRCHEEYSPKYGKKDCYLAHPRKALTKIPQKSNTAYYRCRFCTKEYWVQLQEGDGLNVGYCYVGAHTSNPRDVGYAPLGAAQSCEDKGCIEFYV